MFRVDLRLRPECSTGAIANSVAQLERITRRSARPFGRPWARQAWIKARACAGDIAAGRLRIVSFADGRLTLEFANADQGSANSVAARLRQSGLIVEAAPNAGAQARPGVLIVRAP